MPLARRFACWLSMAQLEWLWAESKRTGETAGAVVRRILQKEMER